MKHIYLCGHTGSQNRGCEAIIRSTAQIFRDIGVDNITVFTFDEEADQRCGLGQVTSLCPYPSLSMPKHVYSYARRKLLSDGVWGHRQRYKTLLCDVDSDAIILNVGGDQYCSSHPPTISYALNLEAERLGLPTVFWGCSVSHRVQTDPVMRSDCMRYSRIIARENRSYAELCGSVEDLTRVRLACDPAFWLPAQENPLPDGFRPYQTVGLNLSPFLVTDPDDPADPVMRSAEYFIHRILEETDLSICLIPHVYHAENNTQDLRVLRALFRRCGENSRISCVEKEYSCTQLKYIISRCRFFIGARTHAMIAAYSSGVPALALSYSVKSIGIAEDLLGDPALYTMDRAAMHHPETLYLRFQTAVMDRETWIRNRYASVLPGYRETICKEAEELLRTL